MRPQPLRGSLAALATVLLVGCAHNPYTIPVDATGWIRDLGSDDQDVSDAADDKFIALGPASVPPLVAALQREPAAVRVGVAETLGRFDDPRAVAALIATAEEDSEASVRYEALRSLSPSSDPKLREVVERSLDDRDPRIRRAAAQLCGAVCSSPRAIENLMEMSITGTPPINAAMARAGIAQILAREPAPFADLRGRVRDFAAANLERPGEERVRAALLLALLGDNGAAPVLIETAQSAENPPQQRLQAIYALGELGDARAVAPLSDLLQGTPQVVSMYSYQALAALAGKGSAEAAAALRHYPGTPPKLPLMPPGP